MKVFISHSSRDKWIARRISQDLNAIGVGTFLDEKDIKTGASIDDMIGEHLKDCDDCLMLLSPSALNSHWVLIEIGGAKALGKRLIPILLHVGANEMPAPITKFLARDINDIEKYYEEVQHRIAGEKIPEKKSPRRKRLVTPPKHRQQLQVGDKVQILNPQQASDERADLGWVENMDKYVGQTATIIAVNKEDRAAELDIDNKVYLWAFDWLVKK
ncbi:MAG TPA: toll/interleukin-1 receptor domain-containing protein [Pyrinomonadaceae bacterium]|jgi:hypothetical protein|nr:toll/interleukin-1 receptor domain-containing protein [Pyrinomonadaceae bacterium]